jgi:EAL domain-containing protein (putative c-di-GMP-specific phosphodiesterase class I)
LRLLTSLHCDEFQGYLSGKPVPVEIFELKYLARAGTIESLKSG